VGWSEYYIEFDSVEPTQSRDTEKDVKEIITDLSNSLRWVYLGEEGREINAILAGADDTYAQLEAWKVYLQKTLAFPFAAKISEWQKPGSTLQAGHKVQVMAHDDLDEWYGIMVKIKKGGRSHIFPLCDLEVVAHNSANHDPVQLYAVWYVNR
jgi:hypothetical protein